MTKKVTIEKISNGYILQEIDLPQTFMLGTTEMKQTYFKTIEEMALAMKEIFAITAEKR